jgi:hypothetical protein
MTAKSEQQEQSIPPPPDTPAPSANPQTLETKQAPEMPDVSGLPVGGEGMAEEPKSQEEVSDAMASTRDLPLGGKGDDSAGDQA